MPIAPSFPDCTSGDFFLGLGSLVETAGAAGFERRLTNYVWDELVFGVIDIGTSSEWLHGKKQRKS